ncbi:hypothetical protein P0I90_000869 [Vibrio parahaemolyticus]|uniref:hypothetical protein n=1 Tax=Vibrio parahaemolyticus TaxID=670 RepID=UPI00111FDF03|nr:hypothetical protein [Vibrio parahaemolyticus]HDY8127903.1 hypothetical protein [Vibrio vulnificus]EJG1819750.1 hypothetical protein [Vibrio parahaemolyticus]EKO5206924.1 hypothetical protein [Vibrio parahaemolyticus]ELA7289284.1 hypothetical protein [Vibrio parahaemolyticus]MBE4250023.1 hypothetical protein [Vibrio parahaemolyticus]
MTFEKFVAVLGLIATIPVYKGWFQSALSWNKARKLSALENRLALITKLHEDSKQLTTYIGQSVLTVLAFIAASQVYQLVSVTANKPEIGSVFISTVSLIAYLTAINFVGRLTQVRDFEKHSRLLVDRIEKLRA